MKLQWLLLSVLSLQVLYTQALEDINAIDDDFAEFETSPTEDEEIDTIKIKEIFSEDFEDDIEVKAEDEFVTSQDDDDDMVVDEDNEFEHFQDTEEFEGYQDSQPPRAGETPDLKISKVPVTLRQRWDAYWLEMILCCLLAAYALAYVVGRSRNTNIALEFLHAHKPLLDENFTLVGETGSDVVSANGGAGWRREAEHCFTMWCSGRLCCEGMLLTLKLAKRQDLVHAALGLARPSPDTLQVRVDLNRDEGDPFVLCVAQKKIAAKLAKEMQDLSVFCGERRPGERHGLPASLSVLAECAEAAGGVLDARTCAVLAQYPRALHSLHVSDRYCGPKQIDDQPATKPPETERVLLATFALGDDPAEMRAMLQLLFHILDKTKRLRLSKEALAKCEKRRQKVAELWQRGAHAARQEQAAARREEKRKLEKEKILAEDDPEKQRKWELKEQKRQQKRKVPKMKQLKVKAL